MIVYLAAISTMEPFFKKGLLKIEEVSVLASYYGVTEFEENNASKFKNIIIDSGAFSFMQGKRVGSWDKYTEQYAEWINEHKIEKFFELDIDSIVGIKEVERLRAKLERLTGKQPIPVWHINRGWEYYKMMVREYPYVAFGGLHTDGISTKKIENAFPAFIKEAHKNKAKIHGLGYTSIQGLTKFHFDSVDSTTWLVGAKYGNICKVGTTMGRQEHRQGKRVKDSRELAFYNFREWLKFQKYAERFL